MFAFGTLFFFSFTGITLNHTDWFAAEQSVDHHYDGQIDLAWLNVQPDDDSVTVNDDAAESESEIDLGAEVKKLEVAEFLRKSHALKGAVTNFSVDEYQCVIVFAGPGYTADVFVDRETGEYEIDEAVFGAFAIMNDLHKGRDTGNVWKLVIDISAIVCCLVSLTGVWLMFYIRGRWVFGLMTGLVGCLLLFCLYLFFVP